MAQKGSRNEEQISDEDNLRVAVAFGNWDGGGPSTRTNSGGERPGITLSGIHQGECPRSYERARDEMRRIFDTEGDWGKFLEAFARAAAS